MHSFSLTCVFLRLVIKKSLKLTSCVSNQTLDIITQSIRDGHVETLAKDPMARLWIQYFDIIRILRKFIRAERLGNRYLHIETVSDMLPY